MKRVGIEFMRQPTWLAVWLPACLAVGVTAGMLYAKGRSVQNAARSVESQTARLTLQARSVRDATAKARAAQAADSGLQQQRTVAKLLRQDWNPAFATVESLQLPGIRLVQLSFDASSQAVRIEYEVESVAQATAVTSAINSGFDAPPWRLEGITAGAAAGITGPQRMRATWVTQLHRLR